MPPSTMVPVVLCTVIIIALRQIVSHELGRQDIWDDPVLKNFTDTVSTVWMLNDRGMEYANTLYPNFTSITNGTFMVNGTTGSASALVVDDKRFYLTLMPLNILYYVLIVSLRYCWYIALEHAFPARPRAAVEVAYQPEKKEKAFDDDEHHDEEVVKRWIAQGKVRRASISWTNTCFKWVLDLTVGNIVIQCLFELYNGLVFGDGLSATLVHLKTVSSSIPPLHASWASGFRKYRRYLLTKTPNLVCPHVVDIRPVLR